MLAGKTSLFAALSARAAFSQARHAVVTQNIANADTPGFAPRDLKDEGLDKLVAARSSMPAPLLRTDSRHLAGIPKGGFGDEQSEVDGFEVTLDGNEVNLEEQAQKLAETRFDHQLAVDLYRKYVGLMKTAIGTGR